MDEFTVPVRRADGRWVDLADLLDLIPENDLCWWFSDFEGVGGQGPRGETILEFEESVSNSQGGYALSWSELVRFAGQLTQVINCHLAARAASEPKRAVDEHHGEAQPVVVIEAVDSTVWEIQVADDELFRRFSEFAVSGGPH